MQDPLFVNAMQSTKEMYANPEKAAEIVGDLRRASVENDRPKLTDAELGLRELSKAASDPKLMMEG